MKRPRYQRPPGAMCLPPFERGALLAAMLLRGERPTLRDVIAATGASFATAKRDVRAVSQALVALDPRGVEIVAAWQDAKLGRVPPQLQPQTRSQQERP